MPLYDYKCGGCGNEFGGYHSLKESERTTCPKCGQQAERDYDGCTVGISMDGNLFRRGSLDHGDGRYPLVLTKASRGRRKNKRLP